MKIITWNVNSLRVRLDSLITLIKTEQPDIVALQEIKITDPDFPVSVFSELGYAASYSGQKTYNGVALLTKTTPCTEVITDLPGFADEQRRVLAASWGGYRIINLYVPNGSELSSDKYQYKLKWLAACAKFIEQQLAQHSQVLVLGDFNIAPTDQDVWDAAIWQNCVLVSEPERTAFQGLLALGLVDIFRSYDPQSIEFSWWDYRAAGFRRNQGLRIDLILANEDLAKRCNACRIAKEIRKLERPSDHAPVIAEFA
jgi:exodeoxyribonuclease-3